MDVRIIKENKKAFLDLLLLGDEQESMIDRYLDRGEMFALYDDGNLKSICVVTRENDATCEIKNLATYPEDQRKGYGSSLIKYIVRYYRESCETIVVGTGESPAIIRFYEDCGFKISHRIKNFFVDHYDHPMYDNGVRLIDMIYLKKESKTSESDDRKQKLTEDCRR